MPGLLFVNANELHKLAREAYQRTEGAESDRAPGQKDAIVAILLAAAALECFINEAADIADHDVTGGWSKVVEEGDQVRHEPLAPREVRQFAALTKEVERSQGQISLKYLLARAVFAGEPYDKGRQPYQDFALLIDLRNAIMHMKPGRDVFEPKVRRRKGLDPLAPSPWPKLTQELRSK